MKKLFVLFLLLLAGTFFYRYGLPSFFNTGAFDKNGKPVVILFDGAGCGDVCDSVRRLLKERNVRFSAISVTDANGAVVSNRYGIDHWPTTLIGGRKVFRNDLPAIVAALAETFGKGVLTPAERMAMEKHYDSQGRAKVVMYGTAWCPYCKKLRELFKANNIKFDDIDVERSPSGMRSYRALQSDGYPLTYVGYRRFVGMQEAEILKAIDELSKAKPLQG